MRAKPYPASRSWRAYVHRHRRRGRRGCRRRTADRLTVAREARARRPAPRRQHRRRRRLPDRHALRRRPVHRRHCSPRRCGGRRSARRDPGQRVNLERALPADGRLGGHFVQGHVDGTAPPARDRPRRRGDRPALHRRRRRSTRYVVEKGFVAVDGVSLTVVERRSPTRSRSRSCRYTQEHVALLDKRPGDLVNVEVDILAKYVERFVGGGRARLSGRVTDGVPGRARLRIDAGRGPARSRAERLLEGRCRHGTRISRAGDRRLPRRAGSSSSSTTRTARTRATWRSPPRRSRPRRSTSWPTHGARADLRRAARRAPRRPADPAHGPGQHVPLRDGVLRLGRGSARRHDRHLGLTTARRPSRRSSTRRWARRTSSGPATRSRCATARAACWCAPGQTEASVDLARLGRPLPGGVICEVMNDDGTMARLPAARGLRRSSTISRSSASPS